MINNIKFSDPETYNLLLRELKRQKSTINLIASENFVSEAVLEALGSIATNKYSEGYPKKRYYGGNKHIDEIETLAIERAKKLFQAEHVNVQPLSGSPANVAVYFALLQPGDKILSLDLANGGHLTHGSPVTHLAKIFKFIHYSPDKNTGNFNFKQIRELALKEKPKLILAGYTCYTKDIDYQKFQEIAGEINAFTMADIAHIAGMVAAGEMNNPVPIFDVVTTTTHKTLRGPRGGMIMCKEVLAKQIDKSVFPSFQGGPHENAIAAKSICFQEAATKEFKEYSQQILKNAKALAEELKKLNFNLVFGGTENHLILIDMQNKNITGKEAEDVLNRAGIVVNRNAIPDDPRKPWDPSGVRIGTPAVTTLGMKEEDMKTIANAINDVINNTDNEEKITQIKTSMENLANKFPIYQNLIY
jgi:glycine hydroxymethyltransferase